MRIANDYETTDCLWSGESSSVYRAAHVQDGHRVVLKVLNDAYPTPELTASLRREHQLLAQLDGAGVSKVLAFEHDQHRSLIVFEDFGGESLSTHQLAGMLSWSEFIDLAIEISKAIATLHRRDLVHKHVNPSHILLNRTTGEVKLADLGGATALAREEPDLVTIESTWESLAYASPEQSGRMNCGLDYRTDWYSLGVVLYELLTGRLPFTETDPLELVHSHIARAPDSPSTIRPDVPEILSRIVCKLLEKNAERRYQSQRGLHYDLQRARELLDHGQLSETFELATHDVSSRLSVPSQVYGRGESLDALVTAFEKSVTQPLDDGTHVVLVGGPPGVGKTTLVRGLLSRVAQHHGLFLEGKCEGRGVQAPYLGLTRALDKLCRQILTYREAEFVRWRALIQEAVDPNGRVLTAIVPSLEQVIGEQARVAQLDAPEMERRFRAVLESFLGAVCRAQSPVVLFVDDLQWADASTLTLLNEIASARRVQGLMIVAAYRDTKQRGKRRIAQLEQALRQSGAHVQHVHLQNLAPEAVNQLVADTLGEPTREVASLARLIHEKTQGNPLFAIELIRALHQHGLLELSHAEGRWRWNAAAIRSHGVGDSAAAFLVSKLSDVPADTQLALQHAACIGDDFDLETLIAAESHNGTRVTGTQVVQQLWPALNASLIVSLDDHYKLWLLDGEDDSSTLQLALSARFRFQHERVQRAALRALGKDAARAVHRRVGESLLASAKRIATSPQLFEIVDHLNRGRSLPSTIGEKLSLLRLDLEAARRAKLNAAFESARAYLRIGLELVGDAPEVLWEQEHELLLALYLEGAEAAYLCGDFADAERLIATARSRARTPLENAQVEERQIQLLRLQNRMAEALQIGLSALTALGIKLPDTPPARLDEVSIEGLPTMHDPVELAALRILHKTFTAAYFVRPELVPSLNFAMLTLCLRGGTSPVVCLPCYLHGFYLVGFRNDIENGYRYGELARRLAAREGAEYYRPRVEGSFHGMLHHWKRSPRTALEPLRQAINDCLENGDIEYAGYCVLYLCQALLWAAEPLSMVYEEQLGHLPTLEQLGLDLQLNNTRIWTQFVSSLLHRGGRHQLTGEHFDENTVVPDWIDSGNANSLVTAYMAGAMLGYWFNDMDYAATHAAAAIPYQANVNGLMISAQFRMFHSLIELRKRATASSDFDEALSSINANQAALGLWSSHMPANFRHKHQLVEAELARVRGDAREAEQMFERSAQGARAGGFAHEEALAYELWARICIEHNRTDEAAEHLRRARDGYRLWGAQAKIDQLQTIHSSLI